MAVTNAPAASTRTRFVDDALHALRTEDAEVPACKQSVIDGLGVTSYARRRPVAADLTGDWTRALPRRYERPRRPWRFGTKSPSLVRS